MTKTIQRTIRLVIISLLLRNVYFETGIWTVVALAWLFITIELRNYVLSQWSNEIQSIILSARDRKPDSSVKCVDTHVHKWAASTNKGVLAVCSLCDTRLLVDAQEPE